MMINSERKLNEILTSNPGNTKIMKVENKDIWWDGTNSNTLGPFINHACNCVSNTFVFFDEKNHYIPIIMSKDNVGMIKANTELTFDYGDLMPINEDEKKNLKWFQDYQCPEETCAKKSRWENAIHQFNKNIYTALQKNDIQRYFFNLQKAYNSYKNNFWIPIQSIVGSELNEKDYMSYLNSLPPILKTDYLKYKKDYCITTYGFILKIMKILNGTEDYQLKLKNKKKLLLLYFDMEKKQLQTTNNFCVRSFKRLIDIPKAYIMIKKLESTSNSINTNENFNSITVEEEPSKKIKIDLPYYINLHTPKLIFSYLHLTHAFATTYCNESNEHDTNQYVICPVDILSYLYEYCKQLQYLEQHFN